MIAERNLKAGDQLPSQRELTHMLHASRPSIREGISMLETLGIVSVEVGRGVYVSERGGGSPADRWRFSRDHSLREVYQFRAALEPAALALAAPRLSAGDIVAMRAGAEALLEAAQAGNAVGAAEQDTLFHDLIYQRCGNRIFREIQAQMRQAMQDSQWVPMVIIERVHDTASEHLMIVEALEAGDTAGACAALANHIRAAAARCDIRL
ncbi:FadR family transcriptional regulator [Breoghania sp. L-A4]|nr:FadR family transcriptional regulator [Breoghania sp. L-A4]